MENEEYEAEIVEEDDDNFVDRALGKMLNDDIDSGAVISKILNSDDE